MSDNPAGAMTHSQQSFPRKISIVPVAKFKIWVQLLFTIGVALVVVWTGVIDGIAFQTNILALNAALVEDAATAAQSLQDQAGHLEEVVSVFKLDRMDRVIPVSEVLTSLPSGLISAQR
jgi:hypothetical protein